MWRSLSKLHQQGGFEKFMDFSGENSQYKCRKIRVNCVMQRRDFQQFLSMVGNKFTAARQAGRF